MDEKKLNEIHENLIPIKLTIIWYNTKCYNSIKQKHTNKTETYFITGQPSQQ